MKPSCARVLRTLQDAGDRGATTAELCQPDVGGVRFAARIHELRHLHGHEIHESRVRQGSSRYTLAAESSSVELGATHNSRKADETGARRRALMVAASGSSVPRRVPAPEPYAEPPDSEHSWALVWDYRDGPTCGRSYWERPAQAQAQAQLELAA